MTGQRIIEPHKRIGVALLLSVAWFAGQAADEPWGVYGRLGFVSVAAVIAASVLMRARLRELMRPSAREMLIGLGAGTLMLAATYAGAAIFFQLFPEQSGLRDELYAMARMDTPGLDHALLFVVVLGEELLWRALLLDAVSSRWPRLPAASLAVLVYALAQLGSGSWVVGLLAVLCGAAWTALLLWRDNLWPPLITHAIWTVALLVVAPI